MEGAEPPPLPLPEPDPPQPDCRIQRSPAQERSILEANLLDKCIEGPQLGSICPRSSCCRISSSPAPTICDATVPRNESESNLGLRAKCVLASMEDGRDGSSRSTEPSYKIMRIAPYGMRGYIKLEHDGAGSPAQTSTACAPAQRGKHLPTRRAAQSQSRCRT